jgi:hypothetical protein
MVAAVRGVIVVTVALVLCACQSTRPPAVAHPPAASTSATTGSAPATTAGVQASGVRTVLSPVGLNIRAASSRSAAVLGTAAQAATLTVLAHTDQGGGWFEVKGSTVTGWISDNSTLSAPGKFRTYTSGDHQFGALYPETWTVSESPPASVVFRRQAGGDTIVVTTATTAGQIPRGRAGYVQTSDERVVVCGITGDLVTYAGASTPPAATSPPAAQAAERFLAQVHIALDAQHALGIDANFADTSQLQTVRDFVDSVTFPFPKCQQ